jgi:sulfatase maturation enzyme AslB (radical SAM superfamily)
MKKCVYPQNILIVGNNGYTISCPLERGNIQLENINNGLVKAWNSSKYDDFRNNLDSYLTDPGRICWQCNKLEAKGSVSLRTEFSPMTEHPSLEAIQFKLSNRCQLACAHCGPKLSSTWAKLLGKKDIIENFELQDSVIEELTQIIPALRYIRFTGGEPWMDPTHWKIINALKDVDKKDCELHYITNGLATFRPELWESWKKVSIMLSVDGCKEGYEWFRRGASWKKLVENYETLKKIPNVKIIINYSLTPWTIEYLEETDKFFDERLMVVPIMDPAHSSLSSISQEDYDRLGLTRIEKYANIIGSNPKPIYRLRDWAKQWDIRFDTPGYAEKIHPWILKI